MSGSGERGRSHDRGSRFVAAADIADTGGGVDGVQERRQLAADHPEGERNLFRRQDLHQRLRPCQSHATPPRGAGSRPIGGGDARGYVRSSPS